MNGPISSRVHTIIGLVVGVVLLIAPYLFGFSSVAAATATAQIIGVLVIISELISTSPYSPLKLVPMRAHLVIDVILGIILAVSPWLFAFADNPANVWVPHLVVGILTIGYALMTSTADETRHISAHA